MPLLQSLNVNVSVPQPGGNGSTCTSDELKFGGKRVQANFDLYNVFNASPVVTFNSTYGTFGSATAGSVYRQPTQILDGRLAKFSVQFDF